MQEKTYIDKVFERFDTDKSGRIEGSQLLPLLQDIEPKYAAGEDDVQFVLVQCGCTIEAGLGREELLPAVGEWKGIVSERLAEVEKSKAKGGSSACALL